MAVEEVASEEYRFGHEMRDEGHQPVQVVSIDLLRHGDARLPEMPRLPEVQVGHNQAFLLLPVKATLG
jgi:hypothetical protein